MPERLELDFTETDTSAVRVFDLRLGDGDRLRWPEAPMRRRRLFHGDGDGSGARDRRGCPPPDVDPRRDPG